MTVTQAAKIMGIHPTTLIRWIDMGEGPRAFVKQGVKGRTIRIRDCDFEAWYRSNSKGRLPC